MESFLLDTDTIIYWIKNKYPQIGQMIEKVGSQNIFVSSISIAELFYGAHNSEQKQKNLKLIAELVEEVNIIDFDSFAGGCFGEIKANLRSKGELINDSDLFIAAIAISNDLILVTNNEKHFQRIEKLKIANWTK